MQIVINTQKALYNVLTSDVLLMSMVTAVYDNVQQAKSFPYITIGEIEVKDNSVIGKNIYALEVRISVYSKYSGRNNLLEIAERVKSILDKKPLNIEDFTHINTVHKLLATDLLDDGQTYAGVMVFSVMAY